MTPTLADLDQDGGLELHAGGGRLPVPRSRPARWRHDADRSTGAWPGTIRRTPAGRRRRRSWTPSRPRPRSSPASGCKCSSPPPTPPNLPLRLVGRQSAGRGLLRRPDPHALLEARRRSGLPHLHVLVPGDRRHPAVQPQRVGGGCARRDLRRRAWTPTRTGRSIRAGPGASPPAKAPGTATRTRGHTGQNVLGYALDGDYADNLTQTRYATTGPIDCRGYKNIRLSFWRWLGVESPYDYACVQVSSDGVNWTDLWTTGRLAHLRRRLAVRGVRGPRRRRGRPGDGLLPLGHGPDRRLRHLPRLEHRRRPGHRRPRSQIDELLHWTGPQSMLLCRI